MNFGTFNKQYQINDIEDNLLLEKIEKQLLKKMLMKLLKISQVLHSLIILLGLEPIGI